MLLDSNVVVDGDELWNVAKRDLEGAWNAHIFGVQKVAAMARKQQPRWVRGEGLRMMDNMLLLYTVR